jgi:hypothetical protein
MITTIQIKAAVSAILCFANLCFGVRQYLYEPPDEDSIVYVEIDHVEVIPNDFNIGNNVHISIERNSVDDIDVAYTLVYTFNERSERVKYLQSLLDVTQDGHYGYITRKAHLKYLRSVGLPVGNVPDLPSNAVDSIPADPTKRCPQFEQLFHQYGLEPVDTFSYIAYRESKCNPKAVNAKWDSNGNLIWSLNKNGTYDSGLLQINSGWRSVVKRICRTDLTGLFLVDCNLKVAKFILDNTEGGLRNWNSYSG